MISIADMRKGEPMSWGIAETASEIEKIKSESSDYLIWLNACGIIDRNTYNYVSDFYADLLMKAYKQGEKDAQPESCEDAVSRKELLKLFSNNPEGSWTYDTVAIGYIKALPSVMPERHTCDTCKHYPPSKKWPCVDCNMRNPADRWETDMR